MKLIALDLGTNTGWATWHDGDLRYGTQVLATDKELREQKKANRHRCCDCRPSRLRAFIETLLPADGLWFEDLTFSTTTYQTQLWASLRAVLQLKYPSVEVACVPVGTLKKFATGNGAAKKDGMAEWLIRKYPERFCSSPEGAPKWAMCADSQGTLLDDNSVDAIHLLYLALQEVKP